MLAQQENMLILQVSKPTNNDNDNRICFSELSLKFIKIYQTKVAQ